MYFGPRRVTILTQNKLIKASVLMGFRKYCIKKLGILNASKDKSQLVVKKVRNLKI
jgi:hypothetical protein